MAKPRGVVTQRSSVRVTYEYDNLDRMTAIKRSGTTLLARYEWDAL